MEDNTDDIQMNVDLSVGASFRKEKKQKLTKLERIKKKKIQGLKEAKLTLSQGNTITENAASKSSGDKQTEDAIVKQYKKGIKRKMSLNDSREIAPKKMKYSAIFTSNPVIPHVKHISVKPVKEDVFSAKDFSDTGLHPYMISNLEKMGMTKMTAVQQASIPVILSGKDVLVKSQTGSGKTLSYAVPIIERLQAHAPKIERNHGPFCIVIVPTRELVLQSLQTLTSLVKPFIHIVPGCLMGGEKRKSEKARLRRGINVLVSTPGRLVDHLENTGCLSIKNVLYLVIDEADRLLDMGFAKDVQRVIRALDENSQQLRQTVLLSATLTAEVEKLAGMSLDCPVRLDITQQEVSKNPAKILMNNQTVEEKFATPENLRHSFVIVPSKLRLVTLAAFLLRKCRESTSPCKIIVFLSTQDAVEFHFMLFTRCLSANKGERVNDLQLFKLYGDMPQKERTTIFNDFHKIRSGVLLCTDVAARGLDLPHVEWIVQYNSPGAPRDYIHRVGRTARIGSKGHALLFLSPAEVRYLETMSEYNISMQEIQMNDILKTLLTLSRQEKLNVTHKGNLPQTVEDCAAFLQARFEENLGENKEMRTLARKAFQSFVRAYATFPSSLKHVFHIKNLHLGHVATSFALVEAPSKISELVGKYARFMKTTDKRSLSRSSKVKGSRFTAGKRSNSQRQSSFAGRMPKNFSAMSEFDSGLDFGTKRKK